MTINQVWTTMLSCMEYMYVDSIDIFNCFVFCFFFSLSLPLFCFWLFACRFSFDFISINFRWCKLFSVQTYIVRVWDFCCIPCYDLSRPMVAYVGLYVSIYSCANDCMANRFQYQAIVGIVCFLCVRFGESTAIPEQILQFILFFWFWETIK